MSIIQTIIVDDEPIARRRIRKLLAKHPVFEIIGEYGNGVEAYHAIQNGEIDVVFLDIEMPEMSGMEVIAKLPEEDRPLIVFVTAYNRYALEAFHFFAIDYLLKPFTEARFDKTIGRIQKLVKKEGIGEVDPQLKALLNFLQNEERKSTKKRLPISLGNKVYFIHIEEIQYVIASGNYVNIYANNTKHVLREALNSFVQKLASEDFIRIHKSYIINQAFVKELRKTSTSSYSVVMTNGESFNISKTYKQDTLSKLL